MHTHRAIVYRLDPTPQQALFLWRCTAAARLTYNLALEQRQHAWAMQRRSLSFAAQCRDLPELKTDVPWLGRVPKSVLQYALRDLGTAYANFFGGRAKFPTFKSRRRTTPSCRLANNQASVEPEHHAVTIAKLGRVRARLSAPLPGRLLSMAISFQYGHWWAACACEVAAVDVPIHQGPTVGIDVGVAQTITLSSGEHLNIPRPKGRDHRAMARLRRQKARRTRGSRGARRTAQRLQRRQTRAARQRTDWLAQQTTALLRSFSGIAIEDLRVSNMTRRAKGKGRAAKAGLNRALLESCLGRLRTLLEQKAVRFGAKVRAVDPRHTSQTCHACGVVDALSRETQTRFCCTACGHTAHADVNAALNIHDRAGWARIVALRCDHAGGVGGYVSPTVNPDASASSMESSLVP